MNHLEKKILDIIEKKYKCKYNKGIEVTQLISGGYKLVLDLGNPDLRQIHISADLNEEDFLKYIEKELVSRLLQKVQFFTGIKQYPEDEERRTYCENR